jgi:uncharacterized protein involved in exopolysaccharide biosynthesis
MTLASGLHRIAAMLWRRKLLLLLLFLLCGGGSAVLILLSPPRYVAQATLLAKFGREYLLRGEGTGPGAVPANFGQEDIVASVVEILRTRSLAESVVAEMRPEVLYPDLADTPDDAVPLDRHATLRLIRDLSVAPAKRSNLIVVELANANPQIASAALNHYISAFQAKYLLLYGENRVEFLEKDLASSKAELDAAQEALSGFEGTHAAFGKAEQMEALVRRRSELEAQRVRIAECCAQTPAAADLNRQVEELDRRIGTLNEHQNAVQALSRRRDITLDSYVAALKRLQEARSARTMDDAGISSVQVVEPAEPPLRPARPGRLVKLVLALVISGVFAAVVTVLADLVSRRVHTADRLRRSFPFSVLADVPPWTPVK